MALPIALSFWLTDSAGGLRTDTRQEKEKEIRTNLEVMTLFQKWHTQHHDVLRAFSRIRE